MDEYLGVIKYFATTYAPQGWRVCDGAILAISTNSALFSLLGTMYGGDGVKTFALPNLPQRLMNVGECGYAICVAGVYPPRQ